MGACEIYATVNAYNYKSFSLEVKDIDAKQGIVQGYFSKFDVVDSYGEVVMPGAFKKTIQENGPQSLNPRIKHILNHDITLPVGKLTELKEDSLGLTYTSQVGTHTLGQDFIKMAESGLITEHSIGYQVTKWEREKSNDKVVKLIELKLWEGSSLTGWGVNQYTPLTAMKSDAMVDRLARLEKFVRNTTASDETIELLFIEIKQLHQLVSQMKATQPAHTTEPVVEKVEDVDWSLILKSIQK